MKLKIEIPEELEELFNEVLNDFKKTVVKEKILVPDDIKIEKRCWDWDRMGIVFNDDKQVLSYASYNWWVYCVDGACDEEFIQCELIKCDRKDLKVWDTAFGCNGDVEEKKRYHHRYCKILDEEKYTYVSHNEDTIVDDESFDNWYKVVEV